MSSFLCDFLGTLSLDFVRVGLTLQLLMKLLYFTIDTCSEGLLLTKDPFIFEVEYHELLFAELPMDFFEKVRLNLLLLLCFFLHSSVAQIVLKLFLFFIT
jgi:hypothetical protein